MRQLVILHGAPGAGKSQWVREVAGLSPYTLCPDDIRLLFEGPVMTPDGEYTISQDGDTKVWNFLYERMEERMGRGELVVVDAMNHAPKSFTRYKELCDRYRYRATVVDFFSWVPIETCKERNLTRTPRYKRVPEGLIDRVYASFALYQPPGWVSVQRPEEFLASFNYLPKDLSNYEAVVFFGDLQGCLDPLIKYFELHPYNPKWAYVFIGDWLDRGRQNGEVLQYMLQNYRQNWFLLEGNHEAHVQRWARGEEARSREFESTTKPQLEAAGIDKKAVRELCRKLQQILYFSWNGVQVFACHGGVPELPENPLLLHTTQYIWGVGKYEDDVDAAWEQNVGAPHSVFQVHGHRNEYALPVQATPHSFNLEGGVEFGGDFRVATLSRSGWTTLALPNEAVDARYLPPATEEATSLPLLEQLRRNPLVNEKRHGNVCAFNFSKEVFYGRLFDRQNVKARGLFINVVTGAIVARSYDKFFNVDEVEATRMSRLKDSLQFPVVAHDKPNGFLGITGWDSERPDEIFTASKSTPVGPYADWFREILFSTIKDPSILRDVLRQGYSLTFEVIDPVNDPHIIEYAEREVVLLDIVHRTEVYQKLPYQDVQAIAEQLDVRCKEQAAAFETWAEFRRWYDEQLAGWDPAREGYVIEDARGFMTKIKLPYYVFWKQVRGMADAIKRRGSQYRLPPYRSSARHLEVYGWLRALPTEQLDRDVIRLRQQFLAREASAAGRQG